MLGAGNTTDVRQRIEGAVEKACSLHPAECERIRRAADSVFELDNPMLYTAFEKALDKIVHSGTPGEVRKQVDAMERVLVTSPGLAWLRKMDSHAQRHVGRVIGLLLLVAVVALAVGVVAGVFD